MASVKLDLAADDVNRVDLFVLNAEKVQPFSLVLPSSEAGDVLTVHHLSDQLCVETGIDPSNQIIVFKGRILDNKTQPLSLLGLTSGNIVKLHQKKPNVVDGNEECRRLTQLEVQIGKTEKNLTELICRCNGISMSYNPAGFNARDLSCCRAGLKRCSDEFKTQLHDINRLDLDHCELTIKEKRRHLVRRIMTSQHRIEGVDIGLKDTIIRLSA